MSQNHKNEHPWYQKRDPIWVYNKAHYDGGRALVESQEDTYLPSFRVEDESSYAERKARAMGLYDNIVKRAISVYTSQIYAVDPVRTLPSHLEPLAENVDLHGTNATPFFLYAMELAERDGISFVLVDSPRAPKGEDEKPKPMTEHDRKEMGLRPWFECIEASAVIDWDVEKDDAKRLGELNWVVIKDEVLRRDAPFEQGDKITRLRVWTRTNWFIFEETAGATDSSGNDEGMVDAGSGTNEIGEVPLVAFYAKRIGSMRGATIIDDVALACNAIWNRSSVEDESFHIHGFPQIIFKLGGGRDVTELKFAADRGIQIGQDDDAFYPVPPTYSLDAFEKFIERTVERVTDLVFARTTRQLRTKQVQTAEAKNIDRSEFVSLLKTKAGYAEEGETKCWTLLSMLFAGPASEEIEVMYNREFDVDDDNAAEWEKLVTNHVRSRSEWYIAEHPGTTEEDANKQIEENRKSEMERSKEQMQLSFEQAVAEGRNIPTNAPNAGAINGGVNKPSQPGAPNAGAAKKKATRKKSRRESRRARDQSSAMAGGEEGEAA